MAKLAILQPLIPHYRNDFFDHLKYQNDVCDIYCYEETASSKKLGFKVDDESKHISNFTLKGILFYNPFVILSSKYDTLVLMFQFFHITTWFLLLTKFIHRKKIILWGPGISVKRYLKEERKPDWKLKLMAFFADGLWLYMKKECNQWKKIYPKKKMVSLDNTISGVNTIVDFVSSKTRDDLKEKYSIREKIILIFCARFESNNRRTDLLLEVISKLDSNKFGFIIIGAGSDKPDFSRFANVHDYGAIYDTDIKNDLFTIADIYFQPGWVGLSIVEAMAYGKPIFTFVRSLETLQCVEYSYIKDGENGKIFHDVDHCIDILNSISITELLIMGNNSKNYVKNNLLIENMVSNAMSLV